MADKRAQYDNPAGYGHGGLGWDEQLDRLPAGPPSSNQLPAWAPWVGLAGAGLLGVAGLRGLKGLFRRGAQSAAPYKSPIGMFEEEMLGRVDPKWDRMIRQSQENVAAMQKGAAIIPALGRIARGQ